MELFGSFDYCMKVLICSTILKRKKVNELRLFRNAHNIFGEKKNSVTNGFAEHDTIL